MFWEAAKEGERTATDYVKNVLKFNSQFQLHIFKKFPYFSSNLHESLPRILIKFPKNIHKNVQKFLQILLKIYFELYKYFQNFIKYRNNLKN